MSQITVNPVRINALASNANVAPFTFQIRSQDSDTKITLLAPMIEKHSEQINSSGDNDFSYPLGFYRYNQVMEAPSRQYNFSDLYLDTRYTKTVETSGKLNIRGIIEKLDTMISPSIRLKRKPRLQVRFGALVLGGAKTYATLDQLTIEGELYTPTGDLMAAVLTMQFSVYAKMGV